MQVGVAMEALEVGIAVSDVYIQAIGTPRAEGGDGVPGGNRGLRGGGLRGEACGRKTPTG